jgi:hypothetical protein
MTFKDCLPAGLGQAIESSIFGNIILEGGIHPYYYGCVGYAVGLNALSTEYNYSMEDTLTLGMILSSPVLLVYNNGTGGNHYFVEDATSIGELTFPSPSAIINFAFSGKTNAVGVYSRMTYLNSSAGLNAYGSYTWVVYDSLRIAHIHVDAGKNISISAIFENTGGSAISVMVEVAPIGASTGAVKSGLIPTGEGTVQLNTVSTYQGFLDVYVSANSPINLLDFDVVIT